MSKLSEAQRKWLEKLSAIGGGGGAKAGLAAGVQADGPPPSSIVGAGNRSQSPFADSDVVVSADSSPPVPTSQAPTVPVPKREVKVEWGGKGPFKGSIVFTQEHGPSGFSLDEAGWQALQQKYTLKLNGLVLKAEAKLLRGELESDEFLFEGFTLAIELAAGKMDVSTEGINVSLMTITGKAVADLTPHLKSWLGRKDIDIKVKVEARLQASVGDFPKLTKLIASQAKKQAAAHAAEVLHAKRIEQLSGEFDTLRKERGKVIDEIEKLGKDEIAQSRMGKKPDTSARKALEAKRKQFDDKLYKARDQIKDSVKKLRKAKDATDRLAKKAVGKLGKAISKAMASKAAQYIGKILLHAIPGLNLIMTIIDVAGLIKDIRNLLKNGYGVDGGGDGEGDQKGKGADGDKSAGKDDGQNTKAGDRGSGSGDGTDPTVAVGKLPQRAEKKGSAGVSRSSEESPAAPAPTRKGGGGGSATKPDQPVQPNRFENDPRVVLMRDFPNKVVREWFAIQNDKLSITAAAKDWIKKNVGKSSDGLFIKTAAPLVTKTKDEEKSTAKATVSFEYRIDREPFTHMHYLFIGMVKGKMVVHRMSGIIFKP